MGFVTPDDPSYSTTPDGSSSSSSSCSSTCSLSLPSWSHPEELLLPCESVEWFQEFSLKDRLFQSPLHLIPGFILLFFSSLYTLLTFISWPNTTLVLFWILFGVPLWCLTTWYFEAWFGIFLGKHLVFFSELRVVEVKQPLFNLSSSLSFISLPYSNITQVFVKNKKSCFPSPSSPSLLSQEDEDEEASLLLPPSSNTKGEKGKTEKEEEEDKGCLALMAKSAVGSPPADSALGRSGHIMIPCVNNTSFLVRYLQKRIKDAKMTSKWKRQMLLQINNGSKNISPSPSPGPSPSSSPSSPSSPFFTLSTTLSSGNQRVLDVALETSPVEHRCEGLISFLKGEEGGEILGEQEEKVYWKRQASRWQTSGPSIKIGFLMALIVCGLTYTCDVVNYAMEGTGNQSGSVAGSQSGNVAGSQSGSATGSLVGNQTGSEEDLGMDAVWIFLLALPGIALFYASLLVLFRSQYGRKGEVLTSHRLLYIGTAIIGAPKVLYSLDLENLVPLMVRLNLRNGTGDIYPIGESHRAPKLNGIENVMGVQRLFWKVFLGDALEPLPENYAETLPEMYENV